MPSAAGKRVGRVLVGCSKPEAEISPATLPGKGILGSSWYPLARSDRMSVSETPPESEVTQDEHDTYLKVHVSELVYTSESGIVIMRHAGIQEFTCFTLFCPFARKSPF